MIDSNEQKKDSKEGENFICFDDSPEKLFEGFEYLLEKLPKEKGQK
ncbi:MAG: hypothetical protein IJ515_01730 [Clostridia bacterium]|nr:hypothetical protein [Clostridia bacterium]